VHRHHRHQSAAGAAVEFAEEWQILKEVGVQSFRSQEIVGLVEVLEDLDLEIDAPFGERRADVVEDLGVRNGCRADAQRRQAQCVHCAHGAHRRHPYRIGPRLPTAAAIATRPGGGLCPIVTAYNSP
jgi:hypothetical protein